MPALHSVAHSSTLSAARKLGTLLGLGVLPTVLMIAIVATSWHANTVGIDAEGGIFRGSQSIVSGDNPYQPERIDAVLARMHGSLSHEIIEVVGYPPAALVAGLPFVALPKAIRSLFFVLIALLCPALALRALGVRDWRCYGATYLTLPVVHGALLGNVTTVLMLLLAIAYRCRRQARNVGAAVGAMIALKAFAIPLAVWLLLTHRRRAAVTSIGFAGSATAIGAAIVGVGASADFLRVARGLTTAQQFGTYSIPSIAYRLGIKGLSRELAITVVLALLVAMIVRRKSDRADIELFAIGVAASLAVLPVVHQHYLALLLVPIAAASPRFSWRWLVLVPLWLIPADSTVNDPGGLILASCCVAACFVAVLRPQPVATLRTLQHQVIVHRAA